jgi:hypothetical protein
MSNCQPRIVKCRKKNRNSVGQAPILYFGGEVHLGSFASSDAAGSGTVNLTWPVEGSRAVTAIGYLGSGI